MLNLVFSSSFSPTWTVRCISFECYDSPNWDSFHLSAPRLPPSSLTSSSIDVPYTVRLH